MSQFANYAAVDPTLNRWAEQNGLRWTTRYKGWDVRSYSWPLESDESIQVWIDPPEGGGAVINVAHNSRSDARRRVEKQVCSLNDLEAGLDAALVRAREWKNEANA